MRGTETPSVLRSPIFVAVLITYTHEVNGSVVTIATIPVGLVP